VHGLYLEETQRQDGGVTINHYSQRNTPTGQLGRSTMLHKRYLVQRIVGQGGMGAVYQAKDLKRQSVCAIKEMGLSMIPEDEIEQAIQNFKIEAKILWGLNHPNLPAFTGFFQERQRYYLVMEYIDGTTLESLLERNGAPFPERRVLGWARQLCDVLEYLHTHNPPIIFRDMKPGNIMLTQDGQIKLIDFGIARFFRNTTSHDTQLLGTPGFAPPEQYGKAQTDERSDIYSLAMTLFQLLTNTLSETGFGLKDIRSINPRISSTVAHALEKAAAIDPDLRYNNVAEFRRALLGVGKFFFENGDEATTPEELAELCARYPDEASDYLQDGEIESWLHEVGALDLARAARHIRVVIDDDPQEAVERFLQVVMGQNARVRGYSGTQSSPVTRAPREQTSTTTSAQPAIRSSRSWFSRKIAAPIQVSPRTIDFGEVYQGISAPLTITISGEQGLHISGIIYANEPWIMLDQTHFDGMSTRINVRINSSSLDIGMRYTGTVIITPDLEDYQKDIQVVVEAEIHDHGLQNGRRHARSQSTGIGLDDDDDDALTMGGVTAVHTQTQISQNQSGTLELADARDQEYRAKYGQPGSTTAKGWDPLQATEDQRLWIERSLAFSAALMMGCLIYTFLSQIPALPHPAPLLPDPWFIAVLAALIPTTTVGAAVVYQANVGTLSGIINRICTGMSCTLLALTLIKLAWQLIVHTNLAPLQLTVTLLAASLGATVGTNSMLSDYIIFGTSWLLSHTRWGTFAVGGLVGIIVGILLALDFVMGWLILLCIVIGIAVTTVLVLQVDHLMQQQQNQP
jgi:serine/threonine protein kinase